MSGITIIAEHIYREATIPIILFVGIMLGALCIVETVLCKKLFIMSKHKISKVFCALFPIACITLSLVVMRGVFQQYNTFHVQYTITVDDTVGFNEFFDNFRIITQNRNHYIVECIKD